MTITRNPYLLLLLTEVWQHVKHMCEYVCNTCVYIHYICAYLYTSDVHTSNLGAIILHGGHHAAVKSTTTNLSPALPNLASNSS